jgi:hypothetical protein
LAVEVSDDAAALPELSVELLQPVTPMVPATNPAIAAEMINVLAVRVIVIVLFPYHFSCFSFDRQAHRGPPVLLS